MNKSKLCEGDVEFDHASQNGALLGQAPPPLVQVGIEQLPIVGDRRNRISFPDDLTRIDRVYEEIPVPFEPACKLDGFGDIREHIVIDRAVVGVRQ
jgi:hypothetical protein